MDMNGQTMDSCMVNLVLSWSNWFSRIWLKKPFVSWSVAVVVVMVHAAGTLCHFKRRQQLADSFISQIELWLPTCTLWCQSADQILKSQDKFAPKVSFLKVIFKFDLYLATHSCWQMSQWVGVVIRSNPPWNNNGCISNYKTSNVTFNFSFDLTHIGGHPERYAICHISRHDRHQSRLYLFMI